jgi:hypothetical protein
MLEQAQEVKAQMDERLASQTFESTSGGGAVTAKVNGKRQLLKLTIDPSAASASANDITMLEDLIVAAVNEAGRKADEAASAYADNLLGGMGLPGL